MLMDRFGIDTSFDDVEQHIMSVFKKNYRCNNLHPYGFNGNKIPTMLTTIKCKLITTPFVY